MKSHKLLPLCLASLLAALISSKVLAQLSFLPNSLYQCSYSEGRTILVKGICTIYPNHNGYSYTIQWPDGVGTGIDPVDQQTVVIDRLKESRLTKDEKSYYFRWENKVIVIDQIPTNSSATKIRAVDKNANSSEVYISNGNIYYRSIGNKAPLRLTSTGFDHSPVLSPDHNWIAFIRRITKIPTPTAEDCFRGECESAGSGLYIVKIDGTEAYKLVANRLTAEPKDLITGISNPLFSLDGQKIYFETRAWMTSKAIHVVDRKTLVHKFVCPGSLLKVVPRGKYAGYLIIAQHRYYPQGGSYDWVYLFTPSGKEVFPIGDSFREKDSVILERFWKRYVDS